MSYFDGKPFGITHVDLTVNQTFIFKRGNPAEVFLQVLQGGRPTSSMESASIECFRNTPRIVLATLTLDADILCKKPDKCLLIDAL